MFTSPYAASTYADGAEGSGPLYQFQPPQVNDIPWYLPTSHGPAVALYKHYRLKSRGVNVFVLSDDTVVQDTATPENSNTNMPLPWILNDPLNEYSYVTNWDGSITNTYLDPHIAYVYEGGHVHTINQTEAEFLSAAGYSDSITAL